MPGWNRRITVQAGPADGDPVLLLHGFRYDIHSYVDVVPLRADAGLRVIVRYLRGHGPTRFHALDGRSAAVRFSRLSAGSPHNGWEGSW